MKEDRCGLKSEAVHSSEITVDKLKIGKSWTYGMHTIAHVMTKQSLKIYATLAVVYLRGTLKIPVRIKSYHC